MRYKLRGGRAKSILIDTFKRFLPAKVQKRKKMGFGVPIVHWLRGPLGVVARDVLTDRRATGRGLFETEPVSAMLDDHIGGRKDHSSILWALLILELWFQEWVDR